MFIALLPDVTYEHSAVLFRVMDNVGEILDFECDVFDAVAVLHQMIADDRVVWLVR